MLETCVRSSPRASGTGLTRACPWSPLAVLFHCPMCLACIISKWYFKILTSSKGRSRIWNRKRRRRLPTWTFVWLGWSHPATGVVMFWNVSEWCHVCECVSCSGLMSLELKFHYILVYLLTAGDGTSWLPWDYGLDPRESCTSGEETCLLICISCEKMTKWVWHILHSQLLTYVLTCDIVNYSHMSCRISCTAGWHRTIVCALTLYGVLIATWLEILILIESVADVFQSVARCFWLRVWLFIAIQPKAIGCQPIIALQSTSLGWQDDVVTCVRYMKGELSWQDAMQQVLECTDVNFVDFKLFNGEYLNRYCTSVSSRMPTVLCGVFWLH